jgi:hypothetical protein
MCHIFGLPGYTNTNKHILINNTIDLSIANKMHFLDLNYNAWL